MRLTFLRHAESEFNVDAQSPTLDCTLTPRGVDQAVALTGDFSLAIVSPLLRAQLTLCASGIRAREVVVFSSAREQRTDPCDFLEGEDATRKETDDELMERADLFLHTVRALYQGVHEEILVVSHCEFIHALTASSPRNAEFVHQQLR